MLVPLSASTTAALVKNGSRTPSATLVKCLVPRWSSSTHARSYSSSSLPRPYRFCVGASWAGKPPDPRGPRVKSNPFSPDSPIGQWRDDALSRPNPGAGRHIGEDFFYIQDVGNLLYNMRVIHRFHRRVDARQFGTLYFGTTFPSRYSI